jgi:hypothetical protein
MCDLDLKQLASISGRVSRESLRQFIANLLVVAAAR